MTVKKPCLAIFLIPGCPVENAASYHWCKFEEHSPESLHLCYCGIAWIANQTELVEPTPEMRLWRTGDEQAMKAVSGRMLG